MEASRMGEVACFAPTAVFLPLGRLPFLGKLSELLL